tara:strand:+ start:455 stop:763 length:309 start_codon:yes stop_codon:yes gene_type:complete
MEALQRWKTYSPGLRTCQTVALAAMMSKTALNISPLGLRTLQFHHTLRERLLLRRLMTQHLPRQRKLILNKFDIASLLRLILWGGRISLRYAVKWMLITMAC